MADTPPPDATTDLRSVHTTSLPELLSRLGISLAVTTYQAGKLIFVREEQGKANTHFRGVRQPMGLARLGNRLALGTATSVREWVDQPALAPKIEPEGRHDACFVPRSTHVTGDIAVHELAFAGDELWVVNTRFSCLCTLKQDASFTPRWRPPFITGLSLEDRCHLNGLGLRDGKPKYVTALGSTDTAAGWRANKRDGGLLMDVPSGEVIARGLSMPHSPRWYADRLWVLESGKGTLCTVDEATGQLNVVASMPGFTRGIDFVGPFAFVGLSQVRETAVFSGIPIAERPVEERACGVWVIDVRSGQTVAFLRFEAGVQEVFAVLALPYRYPELLAEETEEKVAHAYVLPDEAMPDVRPAPPSPDTPAEGEAAAGG